MGYRSNLQEDRAFCGAFGVPLFGHRNRWVGLQASGPTVGGAEGKGADEQVGQGGQSEVGDLQHLGVTNLDDRSAARTLPEDSLRVGTA